MARHRDGQTCLRAEAGPLFCPRSCRRSLGPVWMTWVVAFWHLAGLAQCPLFGRLGAEADIIRSDYEHIC